MRTPTDPALDSPDNQTARPVYSSVKSDAHGIVPAARDASLSVPRDDTPAWRSDLPAARMLVTRTISVGALAAGLIEYLGWQIAQSASARSTVVPLGDWALGLLRNLGGAVAIGLALAVVTLLVQLLVQRSRKRPLRAAAAAFAFGAAGFLGFLLFLVSLAP